MRLMKQSVLGLLFTLGAWVLVSTALGMVRGLGAEWPLPIGSWEQMGTLANTVMPVLVLFQVLAIVMASLRLLMDSPSPGPSYEQARLSAEFISSAHVPTASELRKAAEHRVAQGTARPDGLAGSGPSAGVPRPAVSPPGPVSPKSRRSKHSGFVPAPK